MLSLWTFLLWNLVIKHTSLPQRTQLIQRNNTKRDFWRGKKTTKDGKYFPLSVNISPKMPSPMSTGLNGCNYFKLNTNKPNRSIFKCKFNPIHHHTLLCVWVCPTRIRIFDEMIDRQKLIRIIDLSDLMYLYK